MIQRSYSVIQSLFLFIFVLVTIFYTVWANDKVVYGTDDRISINQIHNSRINTFAKSTAAMIEWTNIVVSKDEVTLKGTTLGKQENLCKGERFRDEITPANCSGFLIAPNKLVTAGHCIESFSDCQEYAWVFDFTDAKKKLSYKKSIYRCVAVLGIQDGEESSNDFAIIELDRPVNRKVMSIRSSGKVSKNARLIVAGHPSGLPQKIGIGGSVRSNNKRDFFTTTLDTFAGNSGSAVMDLNSGLIEGILVRGETDYAYDSQRQCYVVNKCKEDECDGEDVTRITNVKEFRRPDDIFSRIRNGEFRIYSKIKANNQLNKKQNETGNTPLIEAIAAGNKSVTRRLIKNSNVNINLTNNDDLNAFELLSMIRDRKLAKHLKRLISRKDFPLMELRNRKTPLMFSSSFGDKVGIKALIAKGADIQQTNERGFNALMVALRNSQLEAANLLISKSDIGQEDKDGWNAFLIAARYVDLEMVKKILNLTKRPNDQNIFGHTALMLSTMNEHDEVFHFLVNHPDVDLNVQRRNGQTAAHFAIQNNELDKFFTLVEKGARTDITDNRKNTVIDVLKNMNREDLIKRVNAILESKKGDK